ncbi:MAG: hypothetical protein K8F60_14405 [Melioribacteraceae bacterium]|jgi:hypothetical protein|nr:hypothetical protein [Melioribacteraceae bacterium]
MKSYVKIMLSFGYLIIIFIVLYSLIILLINNEICELFTFGSEIGQIISNEDIDNKNIYVSYEFIVNNKQYDSGTRVFRELYDTVVASKENVTIFYNESFPSVNYIQGLKLVSGFYFSLTIGVVMLLVLLVITFFVDKEKWIEKYRSFYRNL